jgi:hypothetical protein
MAGLPQSKVDEIMEYLRGKMLRDDDIPRIENLLRRNIAAGAEDDENVELPRAGIFGLDGRRLVRPASAQDKKAFEAKHGIVPRKIRNLGAV